MRDRVKHLKNGEKATLGAGDAGIRAMTDNVRQLLQRARDGNTAAEKEILQYLHVRFSLFATRKIRNREAAEDVVQESCMTVLANYRTETFRVGFEEWAWGVLKINIKNYLRRASVERQRIAGEHLADDLGSLPARTVDADLEMSLLDCLEKVARINPRFARVLALVYQGYKTSEICEMLKVSSGNCHVLLHRGRTMLKECLRRGGYEI